MDWTSPFWNIVLSYYHLGAALPTKCVYASGRQRYQTFAPQPLPQINLTSIITVDLMQKIQVILSRCPVYI